MSEQRAGTDPSVLPTEDGYHKEFYEWCGKHELRFQRCTSCGTWRHIPRPMCAVCQSLDWEWAKSEGKGSIHCWVVVRRAFDPRFADDVPYAASIIELDEGPRIPSWVTGLEFEDYAIGKRVEVWFDDLTETMALPKFKPAA
jgi:uncharacterized OB-fold protein